jgi:holo-[acyl-carrier protein] synthase
VTGALLGLGIDSVDIPRFAEVLGRRPALADRIFTTGERRYAAGLSDPVPTLAGRFAAKEAVMKALGVGLGAFQWADVEVERQEGGAPRLLVTGRAASLAVGRGIGRWHVSITHTAIVASAVVAATA